MSDDPRMIEIRVLRNLLAQMTQAYDEKLRLLRRETELIQFTMTSISEGLLILDEEGNVTMMNPSAERLLGEKIDECLQRNIRDVLAIYHYRDFHPEPFEIQTCLEKTTKQETYHRDDLLIRRSDGRFIPVRISAASIKDDTGQSMGCVIVIQDISHERLARLQLAHHATHDALTGLMNRTAFTQILEETLKNSPHSFVPFVLCYLDLDQFKLVNDTCGHIAGDELLRQVANILEESISAGDVVARLGGDEFAILMMNCDEAGAIPRLQQLLNRIRSHRFRWHDQIFNITVSVGCVPVEEPPEESMVELLSAADHACYVAKERGRDRVQLFHQDDETFARRYGEMKWVLQLQHNLDENRFILFAQPITPLHRNANGMLLEILVRMQDPDGSLHLPTDFIRAAERYGLMKAIDQWVIEHTLKWIVTEKIFQYPEIDLITINISRMSLIDDHFPILIDRLLQTYPVDPQRLCMEITETAAIHQPERSFKTIHQLRQRGFRIALDDFGSGMSSYPYLREMPVDFIKIDGSFIRGMMSNYLDRTLVESINQIAHLRGVKTIAEYVNGPSVYQAVQEIGIDYIQGNWVCEALPVHDIPSRIKKLRASFTQLQS